MDSILRPPQPFMFENNLANVTSGNLSKEWEKWKKSFKIYYEACELSKKDKKVQLNILLHIIGDRCREVYDQFEEEFRSVDELLQKYDAVFLPRKNLTIERHKFFTRDQRELESIEQYVFELNKMAAKCEFKDLCSDLVRDRLICGLKEAGLRERLLREADLTLSKATDICRLAEMSRAQAVHINTENSVHHVQEVNKDEAKQQASADVHWVNRGRSGQQSTTYARPSGNQVYQSRGRPTRGRADINARTFSAQNNYNNNTQCQRCGARHRRNECPAFGRQCNKCRRMNHFAKVCRVFEVQEGLTDQITVTAVCASPSPSHALFDGTPNRNMRRRETILFVNNFEMPSAQKTIYRRLSKHRFVQPKYPFRGKFYLTKPTLKPVKGTKGRITAKYNTLHKKRAPFQRYAATVPTRVHMPNQPFRPPKKVYAHSKIKPMSFGEPPRKYNKEPQGLGLTDFQLGDFEALSEPLVDSYGAPIKQSLHDLPDLTAHGTDDRIQFHDKKIKTNKGKWTNHKNVDHELVNIKPMHLDEVFVTPVPVQVPVQTEEPITDINHDMNVYKDMKKKSKKKSHYLNPIKMQHTKQMKRHGDFVVGGQYAEPPLRYRRDPTGDADLNDDMEMADAQSSYVNYKNSNMAFSPQNLNDAFSIV